MKHVTLKYTFQVEIKQELPLKNFSSVFNRIQARTSRSKRNIYSLVSGKEHCLNNRGMMNFFSKTEINGELLRNSRAFVIINPSIQFPSNNLVISYQFKKLFSKLISNECLRYCFPLAITLTGLASKFIR